MSLSQDKIDRIKDWIKDSIVDDYLLRMTPAEGEEKTKLFPVEGREVSFDEGMAVYKCALSHDLTSDNVLKRDIKSVIDKPLSTSTYAIYEQRAKSQAKQLPIVRLYAGLASAQYGFADLSEEEYEQLCEPDRAPKFNTGGKSALVDVWNEIPEYLSSMRFKDFKELAEKIRQDRLAELREKHAASAVSKLVQTSYVTPPVAEIDTTPVAPEVAAPAPNPEPIAVSAATAAAPTPEVEAVVTEEEVDGFLTGLVARVAQRKEKPTPNAAEAPSAASVDVPVTKVKAPRKRNVRPEPETQQEDSRPTNNPKRPTMKKLMIDAARYDGLLEEMQATVDKIGELKNSKAREAVIAQASELLDSARSYRRQLHDEIRQKLGKRTR